jgi:hypothetical protein
MQKQEHIDQLRVMLGEMSNTIHPVIIEVAINDAYNQIINDMTFEQQKATALCTKEYTDIAVALDATRCLYYSDLPGSLVPLKGSLTGVNYINTNTGMGVRFEPTTEKMIKFSIGKDEMTTLPTDMVLYYISRDKIWYYGDMSAVPLVRMVLTIQFKSFEDEDEVTMPEGRDYNIKQLAMDYIKQTPILELRNDNADA